MKIEKIILTTEEQILTGRTEVAKEFSKLNFDKLLNHNDVHGLESFITYNKNQIEGFELRKTHVDKKVPTTYFIRTKDIPKLPIIATKTIKIHDGRKVYHLITECDSMNIPAVEVYTWKELVDQTGLPKECHSNPTHHTLYKAKKLYGRLKPHVYDRTVTESAFGKTKYLEWTRMNINNMSMISDPSPAKIFYAACHTRNIIINELPDDTNKTNFIKICNSLMNLGDGTNELDNPSRATAGTTETADTSGTSLAFTHNIPSYYSNDGLRTFEQIYPYNVINRFYYNLYEGFLSPVFPEQMNYKELSIKYSTFFKGVISTMLYFEKHWPSLKNKYPKVSLVEYKFLKKESRFRDHFVDFAKCLSHYAPTEEMYKYLLDAEYKSHTSYRDLIGKNDWRESFKK